MVITVAWPSPGVAKAGQGETREECMEQFRAAWERYRAVIGDEKWCWHVEHMAELRRGSTVRVDLVRREQARARSGSGGVEIKQPASPSCRRREGPPRLVGGGGALAGRRTNLNRVAPGTAAYRPFPQHSGCHFYGCHGIGLAGPFALNEDGRTEPSAGHVRLPTQPPYGLRAQRVRTRSVPGQERTRRRGSPPADRR